MEWVIIAIAGAFVGWVIGSWLQRRGMRGNFHRPPAPGEAKRIKVARAKLTKLLHGDVGAAYRLVGVAKFRNQGKSEIWYWEKALFDLERDRR